MQHNFQETTSRKVLSCNWGVIFREDYSENKLYGCDLYFWGVLRKWALGLGYIDGISRMRFRNTEGLTLPNPASSPTLRQPLSNPLFGPMLKSPFEKLHQSTPRIRWGIVKAMWGGGKGAKLGVVFKRVILSCRFFFSVNKHWISSTFNLRSWKPARTLRTQKNSKELKSD